MPAVRKKPRRRGRTYLKEWRKARRLTQEQAAQIVGVDQSTYGRIENGQIPYNQDFLERLAEEYGCDPWVLLHRRPDDVDVPQTIYDRLRSAPKEAQERALAVVETLLKVQ